MERVDDRPGTRRTRLLLTALLLGVVPVILAGCSFTRVGRPEPGNGSLVKPGADSAPDEPYPMLEGLVFIRDGAIWAVEDGMARQVIESETPWSLRDSRSGEAITYASMSGLNARVHTAVKGDWRAEPIWETDIGSMLVEVVHDDIADVLWFSASGEHTTTIGVRDRARGDREGTVPLPVEVGPHFSVRYEDGALFAAGAAQEPTVLYKIEGVAHELFEAASLFSPRISPDGASVLVTGSARSGGRFHLWMVDTANGSAIELDVGPGVPTDPEWSPDGKHIAFRDAGTGTVWIVSAGGGLATDTGLQAHEGGLAW